MTPGATRRLSRGQEAAENKGELGHAVAVIGLVHSQAEHVPVRGKRWLCSQTRTAEKTASEV